MVKLFCLAKGDNHLHVSSTVCPQMRDVLSRMAAKDVNMDVKVNVKLWRVTGCHEFLASLGMLHCCVIFPFSLF